MPYNRRAEEALARWDSSAARKHRDALLDLYADVYSVAPYADDPFFSLTAYGRRLDGAMAMPGFEIVASVVGQTVLGSCHGVTLDPAIPWWQEIVPSLSADHAKAADSGSVFWLRELMVRQPLRGRGLGHELHDELCRLRTEEYVALTVIVDNEPAQSAYLQWGYRIVGTIRHAPTSPVYYAMIRNRIHNAAE
ncbi:GNAT family N-acetyltransferase [Solwaraspora sp. WMMD1047]|uniref:GNAT family N-acetyltransferase n=1 Tax=Solwaraspora sp. WMMD1047 TaxID=3016102 RepID=UPI002415F6CD|nr:GNAT family N-acetyltransferase [Solwaraspora sp. WMMD1047]MDG4834850.1 GNAT family N-acetyltransferase [Solwaraspora sp. WMMD1047]